jgi:hypothetical protein
MQVSRPLSARMRDTSLQGRIHGVSAFCMIPACNTINDSNLSVWVDDN